MKRTLLGAAQARGLRPDERGAVLRPRGTHGRRARRGPEAAAGNAAAVQVLRGVLAAAACRAIAAAPDAAAVLAALRGGDVAAAVTARLGAAALCNLDQCFLRLQHAPSRRPPGRHPHSWHQDGAVGHDFALAPAADGGLLEMLTCWIALDACGAGLAPTLEWTRQTPARLLPPAELTDGAVRSAFAAGGIEVAPRLAPGDALVFDGTLLHRTHATAAMAHDRASYELRFFAAVPPRLAAQRFAACGFAR